MSSLILVDVVLEILIVRNSHMTPVGWTAHRHPEGAVFYMHDESVSIRFSFE